MKDVFVYLKYHWEGVAAEVVAGVMPEATVTPSDGERLLEAAAVVGTVQ